MNSVFTGDAQLIASSGLFDAPWYVERHRKAAADPILHYLLSGAKAGYDPHPLFDSDWYLANNPDVAAARMNPLVHFLRFGAAEGRAPHPLFDTAWYLKTNPDVAASGVNPLAHYLSSGASEQRSPHPLFDPNMYLARGEDVAQTGINPLLHYLRAKPSKRSATATAPPDLRDPDLYELRGLQPRGRIAVVLHLYYADLWDGLQRAIAHIPEPFDLFVSLVTGSSEHMKTAVIQAYPNAHVFAVENRGRDIRPFIILLQSGVLFQYELVCKVHSKRSPHHRETESPYRDGNGWRNRLIDGVLGNGRQVDRIIAAFRSDPDLGMVVADGNIYRGHEHWVSNEPILAELLPRIGISPNIKDRSFPGGSIFWIRSFLLRTLAGAGLDAGHFEPEPMKKDGNLAHAVERMFGLICDAAGMLVTENSQLTEEREPPPTEMSKVHIIAYYLPQFHPIPENDKWWGPGFTEWTNVTQAQPQFPNHRQPRLPSDLGFYDLRLAEVREAQAQLARRYRVSAFCYYYYWFNGRRVLERPLNEVLVSGRPDFPFLICWANEPWTRNWDGLSRDVLLTQSYDPGWTIKFAQDITLVLRDRRYFRLEGKPMLLIYRIGHIPEAAVAMRELRTSLADRGIPQVHLAAAWVSFPEDGKLPEDPRVLGLDAYFEFPPHMLPAQSLQPLPSGLKDEFHGKIYDYNRTVAATLPMLDTEVNGRRHRCVMLGWDNTARIGRRAHIFQGAAPANFRLWLRRTIAHEQRQKGDRVVFINAWNEWAEGAYLEPDRDFGHGWLEAVASAADVAWSEGEASDTLSDLRASEGQRRLASNYETGASSVDDHNAYHHWAKDLTDHEWCDFLAGAPIRGRTSPPLPPEEFQRAWVGSSGIETFREAMAFCRLLKLTLAGANYQLGPQSRLLEIGVGWGRIYRVLLRETPDIVGIDPVPQCIELCRSALPGGQFEITPLTPPFRFSEGEFDVVYLYSVFSHLNEASFLAMLRETARIVRPGGFVLFTTVPPCEDFVRGRGFPESWKADAEAGRFLYVPTGGAHLAMPSSVWGWALLSEPYLRRLSSDFPFELAAYHPDHLSQAFVALRRLPEK